MEGRGVQVDAHLAFKDMSGDRYLLAAGIANHWPHGRVGAHRMYSTYTVFVW
jgi:hypothetical protein